MNLSAFDRWLTNAPEPGPDTADYPNEVPGCVRCGEEAVRVGVRNGAPHVICDDCDAWDTVAVSRHFYWIPLCDGTWETEGRDEE